MCVDECTRVNSSDFIYHNKTSHVCSCFKSAIQHPTVYKLTDNNDKQYQMIVKQNSEGKSL